MSNSTSSRLTHPARLTATLIFIALLTCLVGAGVASASVTHGKAGHRASAIRIRHEHAHKAAHRRKTGVKIVVLTKTGAQVAGRPVAQSSTTTSTHSAQKPAATVAAKPATIVTSTVAAAPTASPATAKAPTNSTAPASGASSSSASSSTPAPAPVTSGDSAPVSTTQSSSAPMTDPSSDPTTDPSASSGALLGSSTAAGGPTGDPGQWNTVFDDEFTSSSLDLTKWNPNWFGSSNTAITNSVQSNEEACENPDQASESNNELSLGVAAQSCTAESGKNYSYSGSLINTLNKFTFTYGFMEAKIYVPTTTSGQLINDVTFWADGTGDWPATGELDVEEIINGCGANGGPGFGYHFHSPAGGPGACVPSHSTGGWHTFGADWEPGQVTYYYDGQDVGTITSNITSSPMYLILSNGVDGYNGHTVQAAQELVKYVRVWQHPTAS